MRTLYILGSLCLLNLSNCASVNSETAPENKPGLFNSVPSVLVLEFAEYFINPFPYLGCLNRHIRNSLAIYPVKPLFKKLFPNIPELVTDDVNICEPELRMILSLAKFTDPDHIYRALQSEFKLFHRTSFNVLLPNLMNYFDRVGTNRAKMLIFDALMERKRFDILFQNEAFLFHKYQKLFIDFINSGEIPKLKYLFEYIIANPQHFDHIKTAWASDNVSQSFVTNWNKSVLIFNGPETFFFNFPHFDLYIFDKEPNIWDRIVIPNTIYPHIFERINIVLDNYNSQSFLKEYYRILNRIRFGPDEPELFEKEIQYKMFSDIQKFQFLKCASLANKMDLFSKLLGNISTEELECHCSLLITPSADPIELHKVSIDIHNLNRDVYKGDNFIRNISTHYKITSISWSGMSFEIEFTASTVPNKDYPVPRVIHVNPVFYSTEEYWNFIHNMLNYVEFENVAVFERFLPGFFDLLKSKPISEIPISAKNLKMIAQSESTCQLLRTILGEFPKDRPTFVIHLGSLPNVLDQSVLPWTDIVKVKYTDYIDELQYFKTLEQLERLEKMTGQLVSSFLQPYKIMDYFEYRHIFKYLIQTGQKIPEGISESVLSLLKMDSPKLNAKMNTDEN